MGHDFINFGDRHVSLNDFDILALRHFLHKVATESSPGEFRTDAETIKALQEFFQSWQRYGPGVWNGTDLDSFVGSELSRVVVLQALFLRTSDYISSFGESIPLADLPKFDNGYFTAPQPTTRFLQALSKVASLLPP